MKNIIIIVTAFLFSMSLTSCEDFLTEMPTTSVTSITSITNVADAETAITGVYSKMTSSSYYGRLFLLYADYKGSDLTIFSLGRGDSALFAFQHEENNNAYGGYWEAIYNDILQVCNIIERGEALKANGNLNSSDLSKLNNVLGQAYTLRAMFHFDLVRLYGAPYQKDKGVSYGVPIVTKVLSALETLGRNTVAEVYEQVISDLNTALPLISKDKTNGEINYYGTIAELARVYLYMGDYAKALSNSEIIINDGHYTLYTPSTWVASWKKQFGSESIFELYVSSDDGNDLAKSSPRWYNLAKGQGEGASGCWIASEPFMERLGEDPTDVRWGIMQPDEYALCGPGGVNTTPVYIEGRRGSIMKYDGDGKSTTTATNIKVIRLSEIYLIASEAAFNTNDKAKAAKYLNEIRKRSLALDPATSSTISIDMILNERSKELILEGHRYFDQMRIGRTITFDDTTLGVKSGFMDFVLYPPESRGTTVDWNYYRAILPISLDEINANTVIAAQQNPGY